MHIKKGMPHENFTKIHNSVWADTSISDGALRLYGFIASLPNGKVITDNYINRCLGWSQPTLTRRKKELKDANLVLMVRISAKVHDLYLGHPKFTAAQVKALWEDESD